ncbi:MAG: alpha-mannosidase, partial [Candidatus Acidiferrales bacterium]
MLIRFHRRAFQRRFLRNSGNTALLAAAIALSGALAPAQTPKSEAALSTQSMAVIKQLSALENLPAGEWRFHAGDVPHGEALGLDDSSWPLEKPGDRAPKEAVWFRRSIEIPATLDGYDLTGARIWFQFVAYANGPMPQIIYFNGRRVAMGDDLEPIPLLDSAKPGDKILVAVKLLHTVDEKQFANIVLRVEFPAARPDP